MAENSKLVLPGDFQKGKNYLLSGATLIAWQKALKADRVIAGPGIAEKGDPNGRIFSAAAGGEGAFVGAFTRLYLDSGDTFLQCGIVTGGHGGSETIANYKVIDDSTGITSAAGQILYLRASCDATVEDGIMLPGCELNSASLHTASSVPSNHAFTVDSPTGYIYAEIGRWNATEFMPSGPTGNFTASGCIGNFTLKKQ